MTARPEIHDRATLEERAGNQAAGRALEHQREAAGFDLVERKQFDVANLSEPDFEAGLVRIRLRQKRMQQILDTALVDGVHYGNPLTSDGKPVFKKPMLYVAGAEELRNLFRLKLRHVAPPEVTETAEYVSVTVTIAVEDNAGRLLAVHTGNCNTLEKRFEKRSGSGWTYNDAREMVHQCYAMAEKRAGTLATREVTGATGFFSAEEDMDKAIAEREAPKAPASPRWTKEEKAAFGLAAKAVGLSDRKQVLEFIATTLGSDRHVLQSDIPTLNAALEALRPGTPGGEAVDPPATPPAAGEPSEQDLADDAKLADA